MDGMDFGDSDNEEWEPINKGRLPTMRRGTIASRVRDGRDSTEGSRSMKASLAAMKKKYAEMQRRFDSLAEVVEFGGHRGAERRSRADAVDGSSMDMGRGAWSDPSPAASAQGESKAYDPESMRCMALGSMKDCAALAKYVESRFSWESVMSASAADKGLSGYIGPMRECLEDVLTRPAERILQMEKYGAGEMCDPLGRGKINAIACSGPPGTGKTDGVRRACLDVCRFGRTVFGREVVRVLEVNQGRLTGKWVGGAEVDIANLKQYLANVPRPVRMVIVVMDEADALFHTVSFNTVMNQLAALMTAQLRPNGKVEGNRRVAPHVSFVVMTNDIQALPPKIMSRFGAGRTLQFKALDNATACEVVHQKWRDAIDAIGMAAFARIENPFARSVYVDALHTQCHLPDVAADRIVGALGAQDIRPLTQCIATAQRQVANSMSTLKYCEFMTSSDPEKVARVFPSPRRLLNVCEAYAATTKAVAATPTVATNSSAEMLVKTLLKKEVGVTVDGNW